MKETLSRLNGVFREVFDDDEIDIAADMTSNDVDGWDSLSHVNLILAVESVFRVHFSQKDLLKMKNVGDLVNAIETRREK